MKYKISIPTTQHSFFASADETILEAALQSGVSLPYGCRGGRCGACKGKLLKGSVSYKEIPKGLKKDMQDDGYALFCQAHACSDLEIAIDEVEKLKQIKILRMPAKVAKLEQLSHDVMRVYLKLPENIRLKFFAGQYLDFIQDNGEHRSFSIANAPHDDDHIELHIRHIDGGEYTQYIFDRMKVGEILRIEAPLGSFMLQESSPRPIILMGGGTGFAPLKGIIEHAFHIGLEKPIHLFWGVRSLRDLYMPDLPVEWAHRFPLFQFTPVLSEPGTENNWEGKTGFVHQAVMKQYPDLKNFDIYMSGPPAMVYGARDEFMEKGVPEKQLFSDAFEFNSQMEQTETG
ncbi:MAG: CDP-6-deoxy-delta-3,4-glucoseen reductase [Gammaproteobacteria bacterium]|nr:CDP-6-deoxy-delta-3,4-glucoseen reductase [Gammaproteobacteria bacterium]